MARSTIQQRQDAERERIARYDAILRQPRASKALDSDAVVRSVLVGLQGRAIRDPAGWPAKIKTKDAGKVALAVARHVFAIYPVPAHLECVWLGNERLDAAEIARRKAWYVEVAQGGSLYKTCTRDILTRRETHHFLNPPGSLGFREAIWYAVARSYCEDVGIAMRIARSKVARDAVMSFWRDAARFFCAHPIALAEINDLCDFLEARRAENPGYGLGGRTVGSLRAQMEQWHRDLARARRVGDGTWEGNPLPDWSWTETHDGQPHKDVTWTVTQITTGRDLAEEGNRMRHCVYYYKHSCVKGSCSIWSVRTKSWSATKRVLTLEMTAGNEVIQIRGLANRMASASELSVLRRWATANTIVLR